MQSVCHKFINSGNTESCKYGSGFGTSFFSGKKHFGTGCSLRERQGSVFFHNQWVNEELREASRWLQEEFQSLDFTKMDLRPVVAEIAEQSTKDGTLAGNKGLEI